MRVKSNKDKLLVGIFVAALFFSIFGLLLATVEHNNKDNATEQEEVTEEEKDNLYPKKTDPRLDIDIDAAAAFSLYFNKEDSKVLYEKNANLVLPIASITKTMTALVVVSEYDLSQPTNIKEEIISEVQFYDFLTWKETSIEEIIYPMLIESNNSAAFALAAISDRFLDMQGDPLSNFVERMNKKAQELGLQKTEFINPTGLDEGRDVNYSTAEEVAFLARHLLLETDIFDVTLKPTYRLYSPSGFLYYTSINTNQFLFADGREWKQRIVGGKTGWTYNALGCLLLIVEDPNREGYIINVILGADDRFEEMRKLVDFIHQAYQFSDK